MKNQIARDVKKHLLFGSPYNISLTYKLENTLSKGSIIDIETTGLDPLSDKIITMGLLEKDMVEIHQLTRPNYNRFKSFCIHKTDKSPKPRYGYAAHFEQEFLGNFKDWIDLTQYFEVDYDDENPFRRYSLVDVTHHPFPNEPRDIDGSQVPQEWQQYLKTKKRIHLTNIIYHSICDLHRTKQLIERDITTKL